MKSLQPGDTGRDVEVWQRFLARVWVGEFDTMLPGVFDDATEEATRAFQERFGMEISGLVDRGTLEQAQMLGLGTVDDMTPKGVTKSTALAVFVMLVAFSILSQCMLMPGSGQTYGGYQLPVDPKLVPGTAPRRECPGWFC